MTDEPRAITLTEDEVVEICDTLYTVIGKIAALALVMAKVTRSELTDEERQKLETLAKDAT